MDRYHLLEPTLTIDNQEIGKGWLLMTEKEYLILKEAYEMLNNKINQILLENSRDINKARSEIKKITKQNFTLYESEGSLFIEFDDPSDMIDNGHTLLEG